MAATSSRRLPPTARTGPSPRSPTRKETPWAWLPTPRPERVQLPAERSGVRAPPTPLLQCNPVIIEGLGDAMESSRPLDAYSQIVTSVAERLTPKVASLR